MSTPELANTTETPTTNGRTETDGPVTSDNAPSSDKSMSVVTSCTSQLNNIETSLFTKTPEHSFQKIRKLISSSSDQHHRSAANGGSPRKMTSQQPRREKEEEAFCRSRQDADTCREAVPRDDVMTGGSTVDSADGRLHAKTAGSVRSNGDTTTTHVIKIERIVTTNAIGEHGRCTSRRVLLPDGARRTERTLAVTSSDHVTSVRSLLLRTNSTTSSVPHHRSTARLTSLSDTNVGRTNGSDQRGDADTNTAQASQADVIVRRKSPYPSEPDSASTGLGKFPSKTTHHQPPSEAGEGHPQKGRDDGDAASVSARTAAGERVPPSLLPLAAAYRRTERPTAREPGIIPSRAPSVVWPTVGGVTSTRTGTSLLGRLESASMGLPASAPTGPRCRTQAHSVNTDHAGLARVTKVTRDGPPKLREIRGCDVAGEERTVLGEGGVPHRLLGRISEHKGVLYQRIPWEGCIQVSSTGMNRVMVSSGQSVPTAEWPLTGVVSACTPRGASVKLPTMEIERQFFGFILLET